MPFSCLSKKKKTKNRRVLAGSGLVVVGGGCDDSQLGALHKQILKNGSSSSRPYRKRNCAVMVSKVVVCHSNVQANINARTANTTKGLISNGPSPISITNGCPSNRFLQYTRPTTTTGIRTKNMLYRAPTGL